jgi:hypothetical protein
MSYKSLQEATAAGKLAAQIMMVKSVLGEVPTVGYAQLVDGSIVRCDWHGDTMGRGPSGWTLADGRALDVWQYDYR